MILKAGTYRFNDVLTEAEFNQDIDFTVGGIADGISFSAYCSNMKGGVKSFADGTTAWVFSVFEDKYTEDGVETVLGIEVDVYKGTAGWLSSPAEGFVHTITEDTEVDDTFGAWYIANTNYNEVNGTVTPPLAEITYNGETIAQLNAGETATLSCEGMKMASDVTVKVNSILQGATAYTVSSVDELPTNAVDGSMAIVESDSEWLGVWEFKNELTREDAVWGSADGGYSSLMTSCKTQDGFEVRKMSFPETYNGVYTLQYQGELEHQTRNAYRTDELWGMPKGWLDENNKILTLLKEFKGSNGMTAWWKSNAVRTVAHKLKALYIRENGEWVYKCEVV